MKSRRMLVSVCSVLGLISAVGLVVEYLALCDIARKPGSVLEWYIVGVCMLVMAAFVVSTLFTLRILSSAGDGTNA